MGKQTDRKADPWLGRLFFCSNWMINLFAHNLHTPILMPSVHWWQLIRLLSANWPVPDILWQVETGSHLHLCSEYPTKYAIHFRCMLYILVINKKYGLEKTQFWDVNNSFQIAYVIYHSYWIFLVRKGNQQIVISQSFWLSDNLTQS